MMGRGDHTQPPAWLAWPAPEAGLRELDVALGRLLWQHAPRASEAALRLAVLCSAQLAQGRPCLPLGALLRSPQDFLPPEWWPEDGTAPPPWLPSTPDACQQALREAGFVGQGADATPLVLCGTRLYLTRYWHAGARIRRAIEARLAPIDPAPPVEAVRTWIARLFPPTEGAQGLNWQEIACALALRQNFCIITGGPGTGKTTTVVRLLAILQGLAGVAEGAEGLRMRLAAPTGKAAARLNASISDRLRALVPAADGALARVLPHVPVRVDTLHHVLGLRADGGRARYDANRPLDVDVLVVDEASMIDVEVMDALFQALPPAARVVLLGDRDQLASVEAGAILGELCARAAAAHYRPQTLAYLRAVCHVAPDAQWQDAAGEDLDQAVAMLRVSHRFTPTSGIGRLAQAVNAGDVSAVEQLRGQACRDLDWIAADPPGRGAFAGAAGSAAWLEASGVLSDAGCLGWPALHAQRPDHGAAPADWDDWAQLALAAQARFQVLCALRAGPFGVEGVNDAVEHRLRAQGRLAADAQDSWYEGRPILVTRNQPALGLVNGDMGLILDRPPASGDGPPVARAVFARGDGGVRWISPARLSAVQTAYALTVHKAQGSEFDRVVLVLPPRPGPLLTRELLYTGVTRARHHLTLVVPASEADVLAHAVATRTQRGGGIWQLQETDA